MGLPDGGIRVRRGADGRATRRRPPRSREYLAAHPNTAVLVPWLVSLHEIQAGTARTHLQVTATDFERDALYRQRTELVVGDFPGPDDGVRAC